MYLLSYQHILGFGQLLVLDESLSVLLIVVLKWHLHVRANKMMVMMIRTQCTIWCIHAPVRPPSKISTAVKTTCERITPSKSFLGAVYNHGQYIVVMKFTGRHWLALAPSNQSRRLTVCTTQELGREHSILQYVIVMLD